MNTNPIRTRFAPSPTGRLHIGSVRTALFSYLYARSQGGEFLLRIEDTDRERSKKEFEVSIQEDMAWLGLRYDGTVVRQSERLDLYRRYASQLIKEEKAYPAEDGSPAIKFRIPPKKIIVHDLAHGDTEFDTSLFEDVVIMKSDGMPTYNFACVVDDHEQAITHVIRGDDHLSNTPRQWLIYEALGWTPPKAAHIPLIVNGERLPLSKRDGDVSLTHYRKEGYLPAGLLNYFALLGWSPGGNQEFMTLDEMEKKFRLKAVGTNAAAFDEKKLAWLNGKHMKSLSREAYLKALAEFVDKEHSLPPSIDRKYMEEIALLYQTRMNTFGDLFSLAGHAFQDDVTFREAEAEKKLDEQSRARLLRLAERFQSIGDFNDPAGLEKILRETAEEEKVTAADLIHPVRAALTGGTVSPGLFELMKVLGRERVLRRLRTLPRHCDESLAK